MADWLAEAAADAYLTGWARSGAPLTEATVPGCTAAVTAALEHRHSPDVLEVTLKLGSLQGAWAKVYDRREQMIADHTAKIQALWRKACKGLDAGQMVATFRQQASLPREARDGGWLAILRAWAAVAAAGMLHGIADGPVYDDLVAAIEQALGAAEAEGMTAALAVAAEEAGETGFDWDLAYDHMYAPIRDDMEDLPGMGAEWVQNLIAGSAADIGRSLASLAANGGTYDEMVSDVRALTAGDSIRAVQTLIDYAMSGSAAQGALGLYRSEGVTHVDWLDAGDGRVCPVCESNAEQSPWPIDQFPACPAHPLCRCSPGVSVSSLPFGTFSQFVKAA